MKTILAALGAVAVSFGAAPAERIYRPDPASWKKPRHIFSEPIAASKDGPLLRVDVVDNHVIAGKKAKRFSADEVYYFVEQVGQSCSILIYNDKQRGLRLHVPKCEHRPLTATWINPKLLYVDVFFNPHYGAYWIFDVENERVVLHELQNDGVDAWRECREGKISTSRSAEETRDRESPAMPRPPLLR